VKKDDLVVLELASWQLQGWGESKISPHVAVFTTIFPDHMNYYKSMTEYIADKKFIYKFQTANDFCVLNIDNPDVKKLASTVKSKKVFSSAKDLPTDWQLKIPGEHNRENAAIALAVGKIYGLTDEQMKDTICNFGGLEHRLEVVRELNGITFINDTTATTPVAGIKALSSIAPPIVLIAGGATKKLALDEFAKKICERVKAVALLEGTATDELESEIKKNNGDRLIIGRFNKFNDAIERAVSIALPGDTILLAPGCASFGMFKNEFDRGEQFKKLVKQLQ
ncbi:MAG: UDP-N-acetylmuramoyl-L-alanine--D-glutamate ligase, partial [Parcubacteria group bacterium]